MHFEYMKGTGVIFTCELAKDEDGWWFSLGMFGWVVELTWGEQNGS